MKKFFIIIAILVAISSAGNADAQMPAPYGTEGSRSGMGGFSNSAADWEKVVEHTLKEEKEGKELWGKFQAKEVACADLKDEQYAVLGEYFMGQMAGDQHAAMNAMMIQAHGEEGEEQIHIVMGKRLSGCDTQAAFPAGSSAWMPMMWGGMMNFGFTPFGRSNWIFMILWWVLAIIGIVAVIKWIASLSRAKDTKKDSV